MCIRDSCCNIFCKVFLHIGTDSTHQRACRGSVTCVTITVIISLVGSGKLHGIGIGTIIAMVVVGRIIAVFNHFTKEKLIKLTGVEE